MNHYSPFKVEELFQQLEALAPGRIDLGMGRATPGPVLDLALQQNREHPARPDHAQQVLETTAWLHEAFPEDHPFAGHPVMPSVPSVPQTWLLGSSPGGSDLAARIGIGYTFAAFIDPGGVASTLRNYRERFQPRGFGLEEAPSILAVNVTVGEDDGDGRHLVNGAKGFYSRLGRAGRWAGDVLVPTPDVAVVEMSEGERAEPTAIVNGRWPRFVAGGPAEVRVTLEQMMHEREADEVMIQDLIADPETRRRSHELLAEVFGLTPRESGPGPAGRSEI